MTSNEAALESALVFLHVRWTALFKLWEHIPLRRLSHSHFLLWVLYQLECIAWSPFTFLLTILTEKANLLIFALSRNVEEPFKKIPGSEIWSELICWKCYCSSSLSSVFLRGFIKICQLVAQLTDKPMWRMSSAHTQTDTHKCCPLLLLTAVCSETVKPHCCDIFGEPLIELFM